MSEFSIKIDGREVQVSEGMTVLEAARGAGIEIPTLCHHDQLEPFGGCRICVVEANGAGRPRLIASCIYPVEQGLEVQTRSEKVDRMRRVLLELMLAHAPHAPQLRALAEEYGADRDRMDQDASFCIHCGLCVRYCAEVKKLHAVGFVDRGTRKEIAFIPEIAARECNDCKECFPLCPTSYLQAVFVLTESLAFPGRSSGPPSPRSR
jgi:NADH dehydrogenase/NADH:ubiquinone oxidoreductase subunit G